MTRHDMRIRSIVTVVASVLGIYGWITTMVINGRWTAARVRSSRANHTSAQDTRYRRHNQSVIPKYSADAGTSGRCEGDATVVGRFEYQCGDKRRHKVCRGGQFQRLVIGCPRGPRGSFGAKAPCDRDDQSGPHPRAQPPAVKVRRG